MEFVGRSNTVLIGDLFLTHRWQVLEQIHCEYQVNRKYFFFRNVRQKKPQNRLIFIHPKPEKTETFPEINRQCFVSAAS